TALTVSRVRDNRASLRARNSFQIPSTRTSGPAPWAGPGGCAPESSDPDTGDMVIGGFLLEGRICGGTLRDCDRAARMESASRGRFQSAGYRAGNRLQSSPRLAVDARNRSQQALGIGIQRIAEQL